MPDTENYEILVIGSDRAAEFGVEVGQAATNMKGVQGRKTAMVDGLRQMHLERYRASGAEPIMGEARFAAERTVVSRLRELSSYIFKKECGSNGGHKLSFSFVCHTRLPRVGVPLSPCACPPASSNVERQRAGT